MDPVKVLLLGGFSTHTPPSVFTMLSAGVLAPVLFVRTALSWLLSVFEPRSSRLRKRLAAPAAYVLVKVDGAQTSGPEPEASIRNVRVLLPTDALLVNVNARVAVSPMPT
jgi:hypothetical protein